MERAISSKLLFLSQFDYRARSLRARNRRIIIPEGGPEETCGRHWAMHTQHLRNPFRCGSFGQTKLDECGDSHVQLGVGAERRDARFLVLPSVIAALWLLSGGGDVRMPRDRATRSSSPPTASSEYAMAVSRSETALVNEPMLNRRKSLHPCGIPRVAMSASPICLSSERL